MKFRITKCELQHMRRGARKKDAGKTPALREDGEGWGSGEENYELRMAKWGVGKGRRLSVVRGGIMVAEIGGRLV